MREMTQMRVYIPRWKRQFTHPSDFAAWLGFRERLGRDAIEFYDPIEDPESVESLPADDHTIIVGTLQHVRRAIERAAGAYPEVETLPSALRPYAGREVRVFTSLAEARAHTRLPAFVKPYRSMKRFRAAVVHGPEDWPGEDMSGDAEILVSDVVRFVAEYRVFVQDRGRRTAAGEILDVRRYDGSFRHYPDMEVVDAMIAAWSDDAPSAYALDIGILEDGRTVVVEVNDIIATDDYGMDACAYAGMIIRRWRELLSAGATPRPG